MKTIQSLLVAAVIAISSFEANCEQVRYEFDGVVTLITLQSNLPNRINVGDTIRGHVDMESSLAPPPFASTTYSYSISPSTQDWIEAEVTVGGVTYSTEGLIGSSGHVWVSDYYPDAWVSASESYMVFLNFVNPASTSSYTAETIILNVDAYSSKMPSLSNFINGTSLEQNFTWNREPNNFDPPTGSFTYLDEYAAYPAERPSVILDFSLQRIRVGPGPIFTDVPSDYWAAPFIETLAASGITSGCGGGNYCPNDPVTRAQMAVFLERGIRGSAFVPDLGIGNIFLDVPAGYWAGGWIELLYMDGITSGCGSNNYCPGNSTTRAQMAVFLLRAKYGQDYAPPTPVGVFDDVPLTNQYAGWIEQLAAEGITSGCGNGNYCPNDSVTRAQMAVFLVKTFGLVHSVGDTTITGMVVNQVSQLPIEGARVKIEHTIDGNNAVVDALTDASGQYSLNINSDRLPDPYLLVASASAYVPDVVDIPNDGQNRTVDFELRVINDIIVVIEIDPSLHHLGDNYFGGTINSQFQRTAEGTFYTKQFMLDSTQASSGSAIISLVAKGLEDSNPLIINGNTITYLDASPSDGSFAKVTVNVPVNILRSGSNTVRIESDVYFGDYDDFEFTNIILEL